MRWIKPSTAYTDYTALISSATGAPLLNPTLVAGDVQISVDGIAFANVTTLPTVTPATQCQIQYTLSAIEVSTNTVICLRFKDQTSPSEWDTQFIWHRTDILSQVAAFPSGAFEYTYTVTSSLTGLPIDGVEIWFSTDLAHTNIIWKGETDAFGVARDVLGHLPWLDAGVYYVWKQLGGYTDDQNPDIETVP